MTEKKGEGAAKKKLESFGDDILGEIDRGKSPKFVTTSRSRSNIHYDDKKVLLTLGSKSEERNFVNVGQAKRFMQTLAIAAKCHKFLDENLHTTIRGLFYQLKYSLGEDIDENIFNEQAESNPLIEDLEVSLGLKREDLNLNANRKGVLAGNIRIVDTFGGERQTIDASKLGRSGWAIPSDVDNEIEFVDVKAKFVLCLPPFEKLAVLENGRLKIKKIADIVDGGFANINVFAFDENYKVCKNSVVSFQKRDAYPGERLVKITSKSGSIVHVSEDHKLPVLRAGKLGIVRAKELLEDDFLIEAKRINCLSGDYTECIDLIELFSKSKHIDQVMVAGASDLLGDPKDTADKLGLYIEKKFGKKSYIYKYAYLVSGWKKRDSIPLKHYLKLETNKSSRASLKIFFRGAKRADLVPAIINIDEKLCKLLGYYLAEGHVYRGTVGFSFGAHETDYHKEIRALAKNIFGLEVSCYSHSGETQLFIQNRAVAFLFRHMEPGFDSHSKRVPDFVYSLSESCIRSLVDGYLNGDGYRNTFSTVSEDLQFGMNLLLRILNVPSYKNVRDNSRGFSGSSSIYQTAFIEEYLDNVPTNRTPHYLWERYPLALVATERGNKVFRSYFANSYQTITRARLKHSDSAEVKKWLEADVHPVMVRKIEYVDYQGPLYDIVSVVPTHVFMHASGIFTHNCVEKDAVWQRLNEDGFWKKQNCILISPQGQASRGTRRMIRKLADKGLPIYVFNDCDAWGWYIYWTIKVGSINLAYMGSSLATPEAKFIGVTMADIEHYDFLKKMVMKATEMDIKRAQEMLQYPWIGKHKPWVEELNKVIKTKTKLEQDTLQGPRLTFVGEYIMEKINGKKFLP